ncbi:MAG: Sb-PDE family phosphodiesterase [Verrucomicrobiia bacterium]
MSTPKPNIRPRGSTLLHIKNLSPINYELKLSKNLKEVSVPKKLTLVAGKTVLLEVRNGTNNYSGAVELSLPYIVTNLVTKPGESLSIDLKCTLNFVK